MKKPTDEDDRLAAVRRALSGLEFGEVVIAVHEGEIVQVSRTEKLPFTKARS